MKLAPDLRIAGWKPVLLIICLACGAPAIHADGLELRQEGSLHVPANHHGEAALGWKLVYDVENDMPIGIELKPGIRRNLLPWLEASVTYQISGGRNPEDNWDSFQGLERDLAPSWSAGDSGQRMELTQRLTILQPFDGTKPGYQYHSIPRLNWPASCLPSQTDSDCHLEAIYDFDSGTWVETLFTPLGLHFETPGGIAWSIGYLLNSKRGAPGSSWEHTHVNVFGLGLGAPARRDSD